MSGDKPPRMHVLNLKPANKCAPWKKLAERTYRFEGCTASADAFRVNMERVNGLLMLPRYAFKSGGEWQVAVSSVAQRFFGEHMPSDQEFEEKREQMAAIANAARQSVLSEQSPDSSIKVFY